MCAFQSCQPFFSGKISNISRKKSSSRIPKHRDKKSLYKDKYQDMAQKQQQQHNATV